jgi:hypothetical protein
MPQTDTVIVRAALDDEASVYRDIEIEASKSLYKLAEAIVAAFGFDFDHAFGFYGGDPFAKRRALPRYELFADMGEADRDALGVKKTKVAEAFPAVGRSLLFLFDYGDEWRFHVKLKAKGTKVAKVRYPRVVASEGEAPEQYPDPDEIPEDQPRYGYNPLTGKKFKIG